MMLRIICLLFVSLSWYLSAESASDGGRDKVGQGDGTAVETPEFKESKAAMAKVCTMMLIAEQICSLEGNASESRSMCRMKATLKGFPEEKDLSACPAEFQKSLRMLKSMAEEHIREGKAIGEMPGDKKQQEAVESLMKTIGKKYGMAQVMRNAIAWLDLRLKTMKADKVDQKAGLEQLLADIKAGAVQIP